jgi:hypothetical protein
MRILSFLLITAMVLIATSCEHSTNAASAPKPLEVLVAGVQRRDVPLYREWIGTVDGFVNAEIKAQVSRYLVEQEYTEGSFVRQGQLLFQIDPRPFQADLDHFAIIFSSRSLMFFWRQDTLRWFMPPVSRAMAMQFCCAATQEPAKFAWLTLVRNAVGSLFPVMLCMPSAEDRTEW